MVFNPDGVASELKYLGIDDAKALSLGLGDRHILRAAAAFDIDHAELLASKRPAKHRPAARAKGRLVYIELIGIDRPLHDVFAEAIDAGDKHDVAKARFGI